MSARLTGTFTVGYDHEVTRDEYLAFTSALGFGNDRDEPAATPTQLIDPLQQIVSDASDHHECPVWCDDCDQWEAPMSCGPCWGSGCGPGTATGAYDPCEHCAGDGLNHLPYTPTGTWKHAPHAEATP